MLISEEEFTALATELMQKIVGPCKSELTLAVTDEIARINAAADAAVSRIERTIEILDRLLKVQSKDAT